MNSFSQTSSPGAGDRFTRLVERIQAAASPVMFVSPHLDDAVLSCGALLSHLARTCPVTVLTVFSSASPPARSGLAARKTLRDLQVADPEVLFAQRRAEDIAVLGEAGASWIHLGLTDALFRRVGETGTDRKGGGRAAYPTFRFDAARGRIAGSDAGLAGDVGALVREAAAATGATILFGPLGVGRHVDHLITRGGVASSGADAVYYSDFPYSISKRPERRFIRRASLRPYEWLSGRAEVENLMAGYRTEFTRLFPRGVPMSPETYWMRERNAVRGVNLLSSRVFFGAASRYRYEIAARG
jgi:LmbE family N-acetylglucosaminyl deacetylase